MIANSQPATMPARAQASRRLAVLALLVGAASSVAAYASNLNFLRNSPLSYFQPEDVELMRQNARKVLDSSDPAAQESWSNPKTGASGSAQAQGQFTATDGAPCKRLRIMNRTRNLQDDATYTVCKYPKRGWVINTNAQPAGG